MHMVDAVLSPAVLAAGALATGLGCWQGLRRLNEENLSQTAAFSALFFVSALIHVPLGPASVHLVLNGLIGLLLGWLAVPAFLVALSLQLLLFGFGGLLALGVNCVSIAAPAVLVGALLRPWLHRAPITQVPLIGFLAGCWALGLTALLVALSLALSGDALIASAKLVLLSHLPLMLLEGAISAFALGLIGKARPELLLEAPQ